ncbi:Mpo1 family 2-hydroxy fatty acid dioxygenase [Shewanella cyperi]|uniref:Mpo1 family 2-hydroxy fatty acid dioxygenase n=1 Tax=Shewanella cyperi TaxID=2814292 RepID=UPI001A946724|nr:Mpo1-like protein [Shewanella cyperi]QSX41608.1 DUF962 domain-containing protein [Shewanella cyperi]
MKSAVEQLASYKSVHLNPTNLKTHCVGIPLIIWAAAVWMSLPRLSLPLAGEAPLSTLAALLILGYYLLLHWRLALGMVLFGTPLVLSAQWMAAQPHAPWIAAAAFGIGWVFQLIGHRFEKAKPAFLEDLNQLLIGPLFLMAELYFALGLEARLNQDITPLAVARRRALQQKNKQQANKP